MIHEYKNGNMIVSIDDIDGTREIVTQDDEFRPEFPLNMDVNITQFCTANCPFCYAECSTSGKHGDIMNAKFVDTLHPYTEIALQVNDCSHPDLIPFLEKLKNNHIFTSITVNQIHFEQKEDFIADLINKRLIYGLGISLKNPTPEFLEKVRKYPNAVIHTINGITSIKDYVKLCNQGVKVLILGYKDKGRGHDYLLANKKEVEYNMNCLEDSIGVMIRTGWFDVLSFDNLALEQLHIKDILTNNEWESFYQGDEGSISMYVDLVDKTFGESSLVQKSEMMPLMDDVRDMFIIVKGNTK